jgi:hypothetical protein
VPRGGDKVHFNTEGRLEMGRRFGARDAAAKIAPVASIATIPKRCMASLRKGVAGGNRNIITAAILMALINSGKHSFAFRGRSQGMIGKKVHDLLD